MHHLIFLALIFTHLNLSAQTPDATPSTPVVKDAPGVLIDKIALVINDQTYTLTDYANVQKNFLARSEVAPIVYVPGKNSAQDLTQMFIQIYIIRQKLKDIGYSITDDVIDERIRYIEKAQNLTRNDLNNFLKSKSLDFDTYFQLIKESIELTQYLQKIVYPTIDVNDLEIKNFFLKNFPSYNEKKYQI
jgi:parvulin-like peptidyl-prolyl isomerase